MSESYEVVLSLKNVRVENNDENMTTITGGEVDGISIRFEGAESDTSDDTA